ncbi:TPA: helix-turn-helix transcriptional regulator [Streptococcus equi subsp. zooepidemicus]|uniref:Phage transcriptional repressor n=1 Tax=Streptococcus equi subsp. ruminatorum CECT 5772 TaxID=1051981 RepID=A0A922NXL2_9STRE|nr:XRE family transcriptional regulator [Streptococcus equi]KED05325.1 phage transcriptional repressor [Streptococcus equi subsp. ruminatorum CECT 5772]QBX24318.1 CI-like repressor [Streptococcus phage Javan182]HEL0246035.1 helix-turn-helix transcriptional regulator [Streptococcus equi subsp. zooepidemicus]HEL1023072.1 helix-turn-helix transcriptional regulator [Streptococcus equi subsp. ruminatorum CECT 5772]
MDIGAKLKQRRLEVNVSVEELAKKLGVSKTTIYRYEKGEILKVPTEVLEKISKILNTNPAYFMGWSDTPTPVQTQTLQEIIVTSKQLEQPRQEKVLDFAKEQLGEQKHEQNNLFEVTGISYAAAASGLGRGFDVDDYDTYTVYTDEEPPRYDYAIGVRGDSMLPTYEAGDMLYLVDKGMSNYSGQLCVIAYNGQTYFKKVYTEANGLRLVSLNKKYDDIFIDYPPAEDTYIKIFDVIGSFVPVEM